MRRLIMIVLFLAFFSSLLSNNAFSWDNVITHKDLSYFAIQSSVLTRNKGDYLKKLGFDKELLEVFRWDGSSTIKIGYITDWLREGAYREDAGSNLQGFLGLARYNNHFHNPLKPWGGAGLNDLGYTGNSTILWSQYGSWQAGYIEGDWSWKKTRDSFYSALTAKSDTERQAYFAQIFKGLGHQMHLIQDMSVPAHTRNDAHPEDSALGSSPLTGDYYLEAWAKRYFVLINAFALSPAFPSVDLSVGHNGFAPTSQFIDSEQYDFNVSPSSSLAWGLSEYTNSNFVSTDTIFTENFSSTDGHYFPYPGYIGLNQCFEQFDLPCGTNKKRTYWRKLCPGEPIDHFLAIGPLFKYLPTWDLQRKTLKLDSLTHSDYAAKLVPRAVGYSAGLINYFFRGDIDMVPDDAKGSGYVISNNADEDMNGTFELWYDNKMDERNMAWSGSLSIGKKTSGNNKSTNIAFTSPADAKEPDKFMLVFRGKMGGEENAVAGKQVEFRSDYVFLASAWPQVQSFRISVSGNEYQLTPAKKEVNLKYASVASKNLTVQSNPEKTEHYVVLPSAGYFGYIASYGINIGYTYFGSPFYYRPNDFTSGSPYVLAENGLYAAGNPIPIASGRKPFIVTDSKLEATDTSVWKESMQPGQYDYYFRYRDQTGSWVKGIALPDNGGSHFTKSVRPTYTSTTQNIPGGWVTTFEMSTDIVSQSQAPIPPDYIATIGKDQTVHLERNTSDISQYVAGTDGLFRDIVNTKYKYYNNWCGRSYEVRSEKSSIYKDLMNTQIKTDETKLMMGDAVIDNFSSTDEQQWSWLVYFGGKKLSETISDTNPSCYLYEGSQGVESKIREITLSGDTVTITSDGVPYKSFANKYSSESTGRTLKKIIDYDHTEGDRNYIVFYEYEEKNINDNSTGLSEFGFYGTETDGHFINNEEDLWIWVVQAFCLDGCPDTYTKRDRTLKTHYALAYKIGDILNKIELEPAITIQNSFQSSWNTLIINWDDPSGDITYTTDAVSTATTNTSGQLITGLSTQINDKNMVYTYIVERWDTSSNSWVFDKRIIGLINIADTALPVGFRQEFEFSLPYAIFDPSIIAAIGVTR